MPAPTLMSEVYVSPAGAADSGAGTIGDPYLDLEYAIVQTTFDTTNGTRFNVIGGVAEILVASLEDACADISVSVAYVPNITAPLIFQGCTAVAGDGGKGTISGNDLVSIWGVSTGLDYVKFIDMVCHSTGSAFLFDMDNFCALINVEAYGTSAATAISLDVSGICEGLYLHTITSTNGLSINTGTVTNSWLEGNGVGWVVGNDGNGGIIDSNVIIQHNTAGEGITLRSNGWANNNSIYCTVAGTGSGIAILTNASQAARCTNNNIEGWSGVGGHGIRLDQGTDEWITIYGANAVYDCTTPYSEADSTLVDWGDNEVLTKSPFRNAANDDFFPIDTGNVKEGSLPNAWTN